MEWGKYLLVLNMAILRSLSTRVLFFKNVSRLGGREVNAYGERRALDRGRDGVDLVG